MSDQVTLDRASNINVDKSVLTKIRDNGMGFFVVWSLNP